MAKIKGTSLGDSLVGTVGDDRITGLAGDDFLSGFLGNDTLDGGADDDAIEGGAGDDVLTGAEGSDSIIGGAGNDTATGGAGDDVLDGGEGNDQLNGGEGNDLIIANSGSDSVSGGAGDDTYVLHGTARTQVVIFDNEGNDTFDFSGGGSRAKITLAAGSVSTVDGRSVELIGGGTVVQPLDVVLLQDLSGSFSDDLAVVSGLVPDVVSAISAIQPDAQFGVASFVDKATSPFGGGSDYVYRTDLELTDDTVALQNAIDGLDVLGGGDLPESQIEALMQLALRSEEVGYRADAFKVVVLTTDAEFHVAGDGAAVGLRPNDGDDDIEGTPPGTEEDYPTVEQVKSALLASGIIPIFAVTSNVLSTYRQLVSDLGFGAAVTLSSNSSDLVDALKDGIQTITEGVVENAIGTAFADTVSGNEVANRLVGGGGNDSIRGLAGGDTLEGGNGNDTLTGDGGNDVLNGGSDNDRLNGNAGGDRVAFNAKGAVKVDLAAGTSTGQGSDTLSSIEHATGSNGNDTISGSNSGNDLVGAGGDDVLKGGGGKDTLTGDLGADKLTGDAGADRFDFNLVEESTPGARDTISDFTRAEGDKIDLSTIDANETVDGNQKFTFAGGGDEAGPALADLGRIEVKAVSGGMLIEANVDLDPEADIAIFVAGVTSLVGTDFVL